MFGKKKCLRSFKKSVWFLSLVLLGLGLQQVQAQQSAFEDAKKLLDKQKYREAKEDFARLLNTGRNHDYMEYAYYFAALSAYKAGDHYEAREWLEILIQDFSEWPQKDEALYLLGLLQMDDGQTESGLQTFKRILKPAIKEDAHAVKRLFLQELALSKLKMLYVGFDQDKALGETLADKLYSNDNLSEADKKLLGDLKFRFVYTPQKIQAGTLTTDDAMLTTAVMKKSYTVAFMMPFLLSELNPSIAIRKNQFVYDLYEGMKLGVEKLATEGITINLVAFDTEKSTDRVRKILADTKLRELDLIVGPAYQSEAPPIVAFAKQNNIQMVNPFSKSVDLLTNNTQQYLMSPSFYTQGIKVSDYMLDVVKKPNVYILYGSSKADSSLAHAYKQNVEQRGGSVSVFKRINSSGQSYTQAQNALADLKPDPKKTLKPSEFTPQNMGLSPSSNPNLHIAVFTDDPALSVSIMSALQTKRVNLPLVITDDWLFMEQMDLNQVENRDTYIISSQYVDSQKESVCNFNKDYTLRTNIIPSLFSHLGYETMLFFGRSLFRYGRNFPASFKTNGLLEGTMLEKIDFSAGRDNQFVPIMKFVEGKLIVINKR